MNEDGAWSSAKIAEKIKSRVIHSATLFEGAPCWLWQGATNPKGYGTLWVGGKKWATAHRAAYVSLVGNIDSELELDHLCRVRNCCNPDHLEPVTKQENIRRGNGGKHHRTKTHCPHNHEYSPENTVTRVRRGRLCRDCKACRDARSAAWREAKKKGVPYRGVGT